MRKLRVMQVTHDLGVGGLPGVVATLCKKLDRDRFDPMVLCLNDRGPLADELEARGIPVHLLVPEGDGAGYLAFRKVAAILKSCGVDVVHTHNTQAFIDGGLGALLARIETLVHTDHARNYPDKRRYLAAEWVLSRFAYRVVGVSEHTSRLLARHGRIDRRKILTVPNGIEDPLQSHLVDPRIKRAELGIPIDAPVIGVGVRFVEQKGLTYLVEAFSAVRKRLPAARLVLAGYGPLRDDLERQARDVGVFDAVLFPGRRLDMPEVIQTYDVYALPSIWEGLPLVALEAMAVGCPVVATDVGGVSTAVVEGRTGYLVPPRDPAALAEALVRVLTHPPLRRKLGQQARSDFEARFLASTMARRYEEIYRREPPTGPDGPRARTC